MKHLNRFMVTLAMAALFYGVLSPFSGVAFSAASIPAITALPVIREGAVTPTRMTQDSSGNLYVTDPHAGGILKYDSLGNLLQKITTAKEAGGIAFAKNGDLLVTQGTYVAALDPHTGVEKAHIGSFQLAFAIAVDNRPTGTGNIFVSDIKGYVVQVFNDSYGIVDVSAGTGHNQKNTSPDYKVNYIGDDRLWWSYPNRDDVNFFNRPAGVAFEKSSGLLAVVDSLNGQVEFFDQFGNFITSMGARGYDATHQSIKLSYPQSIAFEYDASGALYRAYILDTFQSYVMALDATAPITGTTIWPWLADLGLYGRQNGNLIAPSDILFDKKDPENNRLLVSNGFGSLSVFGIGSLQPYNVAIDSITNNSMRVTWKNSGLSFTKSVHVYRSTVEGQLGTNVSGDLSNGTTSFTDSGLAQYTTYYYTVRAVDLSNVETTNISQVSAKTTGIFNLSVNINGVGQVNGSPANVACTSGTCTTAQPSDTLITLTATATGQSVFEGWTGDCFTTADTCLISMDAAKSVTAFFSTRLAFRVDGAYFDNLQDAYNAAKDGSVIKALAGTWPSTSNPTEYMTSWQPKSVTIEGGYDPTFTNNAGGSTTVTGRANLNAGKVVMKQFKVR